MPADPSPPVNQGLSSLLERLCAARVQFILVGGLAAVAQGAPITTFDIDIVPSPDEDNLHALLALLQSLHARFRGRPGGQVLHPTLDDLKAQGHCLLTTALGPLDLLGRIEEGQGYAELLPKSVEIPYRGHPLRVLELEAIVQLKQASKREKDRLTLPALQAALDRQRQKP